jgi:uncharacterized membrane protein
MRKIPIPFTILLFATILITPSTVTAQSADEAVVRAVLFYSPTCPHCHSVITNTLVPMVNDYGSDVLQIVGIDTAQPDGQQLYQAAIERYQIPDHRRGVPTLIINEVVLVGSGEIPEQFPTIVEEILAAGGNDWPDIPGLSQILPAQTEQDASPPPTPQATATPTPIPQATVTPTPAPLSQVMATLTPTTTPTPPAPTSTSTPSALTIDNEEIPQIEIEPPPPDPVGFTLAGIVLVGMVIALSYAVVRVTMAPPSLFQLGRNPATYVKTGAIPLLALLGLGIATYLAYVEISHVEAVCGPVGECNIVQSSSYAQILGIPIAGLGVLNYLAIVVLWIGQKNSVKQVANLSALGLLGLTLFGTLFSIYLTWLEIFAIRAVCAWCLSSAVITTILMLLVVVAVTTKPSSKNVPVS